MGVSTGPARLFPPACACARVMSPALACALCSAPACARRRGWACRVPVLDACPGGPVFFVVSVAFFFLWRVGRVWGTLGVSGCPVGGRLKGGEVLPWERKKRFVRA